MDYVAYVSDSTPVKTITFTFKIICDSCGDRGINWDKVNIGKSKNFKVHYGCKICKDVAITLSVSPLSIVFHQPFLTHCITQIDDIKVYS